MPLLKFSSSNTLRVIINFVSGTSTPIQHTTSEVFSNLSKIYNLIL